MQLRAGAAHAGEVSDRRDLQLAVDPLDQLDGERPGAAPRAVGDRDEAGVQLAERGDGLEEGGDPRVVLGREELEAEVRPSSLEKIGHAHGAAMVPEAAAPRVPVDGRPLEVAGPLCYRRGPCVPSLPPDTGATIRSATWRSANGRTPPPGPGLGAGAGHRRLPQPSRPLDAARGVVGAAHRAPDPGLRRGRSGGGDGRGRGGRSRPGESRGGARGHRLRKVPRLPRRSPRRLPEPQPPGRATPRRRPRRAGRGSRRKPGRPARLGRG